MKKRTGEQTDRVSGWTEKEKPIRSKQTNDRASIVPLARVALSPSSWAN